MPTALQIDPSRTAGITRKYLADIHRRLAILRREIWRMIYKEDSFGLVEKDPLQFNEQYQFLTDSEKLGAFKTWFAEKLESAELTGRWADGYIQSSYQKGILRSYIDSKPELIGAPSAFSDITQAQFLQDTFLNPTYINHLEFFMTRNYEELQGFNATMGRQLNNILAQSFLQGDHPITVARRMVKNIDRLEKVSARRIARTEIARAQAEGQLDGFERLGIKEVGALVEWLTAGDDRVCPDCAALEGQTFTLEEARGMIPLHPNCRCAYIPAFDTTPKK